MQSWQRKQQKKPIQLFFYRLILYQYERERISTRAKKIQRETATNKKETKS
jgi:hypothetical protein